MQRSGPETRGPSSRDAPKGRPRQVRPPTVGAHLRVRRPSERVLVGMPSFSRPWTGKPEPFVPERATEAARTGTEKEEAFLRVGTGRAGSGVGYEGDLLHHQRGRGITPHPPAAGGSTETSTPGPEGLRVPNSWRPCRLSANRFGAWARRHPSTRRSVDFEPAGSHPRRGGTSGRTPPGGRVSGGIETAAAEAAAGSFPCVGRPKPTVTPLHSRGLRPKPSAPH